MGTVSSTGGEPLVSKGERQGNNKGSFSWPVCQSETQASIYWVKRGGTNYIITNMCAARVGVCIREIYESQHRIKTIIHDYAVCGNNMIREQALCFVVRLHFKCTITSQPGLILSFHHQYMHILFTTIEQYSRHKSHPISPSFLFNLINSVTRKGWEFQCPIVPGAAVCL